MPRPKTIRQSDYPYHITTRSHDQKWFELPLGKVWEISQIAMTEANLVAPVELISFVLMSNHYHMLLKTPKENIDVFMKEFNHRLNMGFRKSGKSTNTLFGGRYKWCLISSERYFINCYKYVYQNPLRAGIANKAEDYPYSTLYYLTKGKSFPLPIHDIYGFKDEFGLSWINQKIENESLIKKGLCRTRF